MFKRIAIFFFIFAFILSSFSGCSLAETDSSQEGAQIDPENQIVWLVSGANGMTEERLAKLNILLKEKGFTKEVVIEKIDYDGSPESAGTVVHNFLSVLQERKDSGKQTDLVTPSFMYFTDGSLLMQNGYWEMANAGLFASLTEYLQKSEGKALYDQQTEGVWKGAAIEGEIYGVPTNHSACLKNAPALRMNVELMEKYHLVKEDFIGKDISEMEDMLRTVYEGEGRERTARTAYRKEHPDATQEEEDAGYYEYMRETTLSPSLFDTWLRQPYDYLTKCIGIRQDEEKAEFVNIFEQEDIKNTLRTINEETQKLYISSLSPYSTTFLVGTYSLIDKREDGMTNAIGEENLVLYHEALAMTDAFRYKNLEHSFSAVASWSNHKDEAIKLLTLLSTDVELAKLIRFGEEGVDYEIKDGYPVDKETGYRLWEVIGLPGGETQIDSAGFDEWSDQVEESKTLGFWFDAHLVWEEAIATEEIFTKYQHMWDGYEQYGVDFDEQYNNLLAELKEAGIDKVVEEANRQYQKWKKKQ